MRSPSPQRHRFVLVSFLFATCSFLTMIRRVALSAHAATPVRAGRARALFLGTSSTGTSFYLSVCVKYFVDFVCCLCQNVFLVQKALSLSSAELDPTEPTLPP
jgi:hypothetical protein